MNIGEKSVLHKVIEQFTCFLIKESIREVNLAAYIG